MLATASDDEVAVDGEFDGEVDFNADESDTEAIELDETDAEVSFCRSWRITRRDPRSGEANDRRFSLRQLRRAM